MKNDEKKVLYTQDDLEDFDYEKQLSNPGQFPFTRGIYETMYNRRLWTMRQYSGFGTAKETNERFRFLLKQGQTGLSIAFDLPTQIGYDSSDLMAIGEVGRTGVAIDTLADMETLFENIPLDKVSTSMTINATAAILLCLYIAVAEKQGVTMDQLRGTIQNDILKEYIARGTYIFPPDASMRLIVNSFEFCSKEVPLWNTISISGYHIREAGSSADQEVAFTLANGISYVEAAIEAGLNPNIFGRRISFFFNAHNNFFEEIAKYRAARRLWARLMKTRFKVTDPKALMLRFHTQTAGSTLTAQQPENNTMRVAYQALAAVLGGTQSLHTNAKDEALALPTKENSKLALRTQQILAYETSVSNYIDPLAGSYLIEALTNRIEEKAKKYIDDIDTNYGGMIKAINDGFPQREIHESAYKTHLEIESKQKIIVGINKFEDESINIPILSIDPQLEKEQISRTNDIKAKRNNVKVLQALSALEKAANNSKINVIPYILDCVRIYCSVGEISNVFRKVWHEYQPPEF